MNLPPIPRLKMKKDGETLVDIPLEELILKYFRNVGIPCKLPVIIEVSECKEPFQFTISVEP